MINHDHWRSLREMPGPACSLVLGLALLFSVACGPQEPEDAVSPELAELETHERFEAFTDDSHSIERVVGQEGPRRLSVVLVVLDTTRADRVAVRQNGCGTTPRIDGLAESALVFTNASSPSSWTLPGHASLFTGKYPYEHGVHWTMHRNAALQEAGGFCARLSEEEVTIAEVFRSAGFVTLGVASNYWLTPSMGFAQGFDEYLVAKEGSGAKKYLMGDEITLKAAAMMKAHRSESFFLFVNLMDAHAPYAPAPEAVCFSRGLPSQTDAGDRLFSGDIYGSGLRRLINFEGYRASRPLREYLLALYDDEIRYLDLQVGRILDTLQEIGRYDDTAIVIVGDHGEYFFEHDLLNHGIGVYEGVVRVPMIIRYPPSVPAGVVAERVELIDLFPTLLELAEIPVPTGPRRTLGFGINLLDAGARHRGRAALSETYRNPWEEGRARPEVLRTTRAVVLDGFKLIVVSDGPGEDEVYDLGKDSSEESDLGSERGFDELRRLLGRQLEGLLSGVAATGAEGPPSLDPEQVERLRALGYLGED
jgi:arylsulfatase A-like enzyme